MLCLVFFFKQKTAYEMRISDWSSDVCSSDLAWGQIGNKPIDCPSGLRIGKNKESKCRFHPLPEKLRPPCIPALMACATAWYRRSEERRVGKACVRTCRSRWSTYHEKKNKERSNRPTHTTLNT